MALQNHMIVHITCLMTVLVTSSNIGNDRQDINLSSDGGYTDILIAIDERVTEDPEIISELQEYFTGASEVLRIATENRLYFKNFTIVVPENWTSNSDWMEPEEKETVTRARIIVAEANLAYGDEPYTLQPGSCGQEGDFIHFTPEYLTRSPNDANTYKPVKRVVKEFAKLKWGLFDENVPINDTVTSRFYFKDEYLLPKGSHMVLDDSSEGFVGMRHWTSGIGHVVIVDESFVRVARDFCALGMVSQLEDLSSLCVEKVDFNFKDMDQCEFSISPPPYPCDFILKKVSGSASLLSYDYAESVTGFCKDNEDGATHNILSSNLQNANCQDRSAWSVMLELEDFATDYGLARNADVLPNPEFRIVQKTTLSTSTSTTTLLPTTTTSTTTSTTTPVTSTSTTSTTSTTTPVTSTSTTSTTSTTTPSSSTSTTTVAPTTDPLVTPCAQDIVCLCLDVSGSMNTYDRITTMSEAVQLYIMSFLKDGTAVGIVSFSDFAYLHADMTEVTSNEVKEILRAAVPTQTISGTNIAAGIYECQRILTQYTGGDIRNTRILLHSDGQGRVDDSIEQIVSEGVILDTVLFGQGGFLTDRAEESGGQQYFASDERGGVGLLAFYKSTALRKCEAENEDALLNNDLILIVAGELTYQGRIYFDVTIGLNTKMVFKYDARVEISISTNLQVTISEDAISLTTIATIEGRLEQFLDYTITKKDPDTEVSVILTVTSSPVPGIQPIVVNNRLNSNNIEFSASSELIGYMGVFQGYSPVLQLAVFTILEDPSGSLTRIKYYDDGTGKDSVANDGIYTGFLPPHLIGGGSSGNFYGLSIDIQGEGLLPEPGVVGKRKKRCVGCNSLGNVTRSGSELWIMLNI
ncbi:calcium-activated chloride channel regulator 4-like [Watersipora subatra]|uniref:calcium-activated chloride channel regulator 4-like n=1 Tax=Watersipora subatra TaxID=2589382 RepID=UPI00355C4019